MPANRPWFKIQTGRDFSTVVQRPTAAQVVQQHLKQKRSLFPLRRIGWASDGWLTLAEEERTHTHVLGLPGGGKSKFLELLIRGDIDNLVAGRTKAGLCLIDSSDFGNTYYKVLKYCAKVGYQKVCLIDPNDLFNPAFGKIPTINPIHYNAPVDVVVASVMEIIRILWDGEDFSRTAKIQEYLEALIEILYEAKGTLHDAKYFSSRKRNDFYIRKREALLSRIKDPQFSDAVTVIQEAFSYNDNLFINEFGSTMRRLRPVLASRTLQLMVASNTSTLDFQKMISEGWVILANLDPLVWGVPQQRFLGTAIISEVVNATYRLIQSGRNVPFYMYIDEVGRYATTTLADVMNYKRTSRIQMILAHQDMSQIKHEEVRKAVLNCRIKVMFYVEKEDRDRMVRQMYGGAVPIEAASYALSDLQKQEADIRIGLNNPRRTKLVDVPDVAMSDKQLNAFKVKLYQQPWYKTRREIYDEINARFKSEPRSVHPEQLGVSRGNRKPTRRNQKVAVNPAPSDDGANRKTGQPAAPRRQDRSVFSEEE